MGATTRPGSSSYTSWFWSSSETTASTVRGNEETQENQQQEPGPQQIQEDTFARVRATVVDAGSEILSRTIMKTSELRQRGRQQQQQQRQVSVAPQDAQEFDLDKYPILQTLETQTGIPKKQLVTLLTLACTCVVILGWGHSVLTRAIGFSYPVYASFKTLEASRRRTSGGGDGGGETDDIIQWLSYWVVFGLFCLLEGFIDALIGAWFPFYYASKLAWLFWLFLPHTQGAACLYRHVVAPFLRQNQHHIDRHIQRLSSFSSSSSQHEALAEEPQQQQDESSSSLATRFWSVVGYSAE